VLPPNSSGDAANANSRLDKPAAQGYGMSLAYPMGAVKAREGSIRKLTADGEVARHFYV
jgi:hypothetical protein